MAIAKKEEKNTPVHLHRNAKLVSTTFTADMERIPTRNGYGEGLVLAGERNEDVVALCADLTESTRAHHFAQKFPKRFFEVGVAEQNMAAVAAGLATEGKIPFISSYATFSPGRNWEQIRTTISYNNANVKICGAHAGISVGPDGATHQAIEDIATMRVMANMYVIVPCDAIEARKATLAAAEIDGPVYLRFGREKTPVFTSNDTPFEIGRAVIFWESPEPQITFVACGPLVHNALLAAKKLQAAGVGSIVINSPSIKPLDKDVILDAVRRTDAVVTIEEHQVMGGLGGAVSELLAREYPASIEFIGMQNTFGESGSTDELIEKYGMGVSSIVKAAHRVIAKRIILRENR